MPTVWLGQSVDTSSICSTHPELSQAHFLTSLGCAIRRPSLRKTHFNANLRDKLRISGPLMIDSGGFALLANPNSNWTAKKVSDLISNLEADIFVSLDLPPVKSDSALDRRQKIFRSQRNYQFLSDKFPSKIIMPVIHGRTFAEIDLAIQLLKRASGNALSWVGLGGIVPLLQNRFVSEEISEIGAETFIASALLMIRQAFPATKIHAFGAGGTRTFPATSYFGASSADSIGWRQAAGFGSIFLPLKSQRVVVWNNSDAPPRKVLDPHDIDELGKCRCPICSSQRSISRRITSLKQDFYNRAIHNAWTISNQHRAWPRTKSVMRKFIIEGGLGERWAVAAAKVDALPLHYFTSR